MIRIHRRMSWGIPILVENVARLIEECATANCNVIGAAKLKLHDCCGIEGVQVTEPEVPTLIFDRLNQSLESTGGLNGEIVAAVAKPRRIIRIDLIVDATIALILVCDGRGRIQRVETRNTRGAWLGKQFENAIMC